MGSAEVNKRIGVIGLGNVLLSDDAFGPYVIAVLVAGYAFPANVSLLDLGTPSLDLFGYLEDLEAAIIIDCVNSGGPAGELRLYSREQILQKPIQPRTSPHEPGLREALLLGEFHGKGPEQVILVGVNPDSISTAAGLTSITAAAVNDAVAAVLDELKKLGVEPQPRPIPTKPDIWWERTSTFSDGKELQSVLDLAPTTTDPVRRVAGL